MARRARPDSETRASILLELNDNQHLYCMLDNDLVVISVTAT